MLIVVQEKPEDFPDYVYENEQLYRQIGSRLDDGESVPWKLCVAKEHRPRVLLKCHDQPTAGHHGLPSVTTGQDSSAMSLDTSVSAIRVSGIR